jgi:dipeptidyl aminopeptidase/acylaminoacyl peptidase
MLLYAFRSTANTSKTLVRIDEASKATAPVYAQSLTTFSAAVFVNLSKLLLKRPMVQLLHAQLFINRDSNGKRPGIVFMHGGPIRQMLLGFHYSDYYITLCIQSIPGQSGVCSVIGKFRSGTGYGRDFRRAKNQGPRGASEYQDVVAAAKHLQSLPEVDAE